MSYAIETHFFYGWGYIGMSDSNHRLIYDTKEEAKRDLKDLIDAMDYDPNDFRISEYNPSKDRTDEL